MTPDDWRELHRTEDLSLARTIVTTIEAMEFDVRLVDASTRVVVEDDQPDMVAAGSFAVEVRPGDADELSDVLDELIGEQVEFDERFAARQKRDRIVRAVVGVIVTLAALVFLWMRFR